MNTTEHTVRTKPDARSEKTVTHVVIDWSNISIEDTRKLAAKSVIIAAQAEWRTDGNIPESATLDANDYANPSRKPRGPVNPIKALMAAVATNPEGVRELLDALPEDFSELREAIERKIQATAAKL